MARGICVIYNTVTLTRGLHALTPTPLSLVEPSGAFHPQDTGGATKASAEYQSTPDGRPQDLCYITVTTVYFSHLAHVTVSPHVRTDLVHERDNLLVVLWQPVAPVVPDDLRVVEAASERLA